jgi:hypothetical protein
LQISIVVCDNARRGAVCVYGHRCSLQRSKGEKKWEKANLKRRRIAWTSPSFFAFLFADVGSGAAACAVLCDRRVRVVVVFANEGRRC